MQAWLRWRDSVQRRWIRLPRYGRVLLTVIALLALLLKTLDLLFPLPLPGEDRRASQLVVAEDGTPLRAFADANGVWRYPVTLDEISPLYREALLGYEDRWFYWHPGINPVALARAAGQWLKHGEVVSGGSTLTMQVARILDPHSRSLSGKLKQMVRALQLEWHYSKDGILALYLNFAPYGGPLEGVQAASYAYFGKPAKLLSHAEAALLTVLPQSPSRLRPDRSPEAAQRARDKVLMRMMRLGIWDEAVAHDARAEQVERRFLVQPVSAPLLAERLRVRQPQATRIHSTLDAGLQWTLETMLRDRVARLPERTSLAVLVADNHTMAVRAYVGSPDLQDESRYGYLDMVRAVRSPGSTLKPFLYALALDDGLVHSESLLVDAPQSFGGYQPGNFLGGFAGPVSVREALQKSLNVPAVDVLERIGPERFVASLRNGGVRLQLLDGDKPNLSVILGGAGASLASLVEAYASLARGGQSGALRYVTDDPQENRHMMSAGAAWITRWMLASHPRPGLPHDMDYASERRVAWKTGTSYGFRDAWALGVTDHYTIGVWVGRPDSTPLPGHYGAITAAPILFDIVDSLPSKRLWGDPAARPGTVTATPICWPLGTVPEPGNEALCHQRREAWILNDTVPPTIADRVQTSHSGRVQYWVNRKTGLRVDAGCSAVERESREVARWPTLLEPWLSPEQRARSTLPRVDRSCPSHVAGVSSGIKILGIRPNTVLRRAGEDEAPPMVALSAVGGEGGVYWLINDKLAAQTANKQVFNREFREPGVYRITAFDQTGHYDQLSVKVIQ